MFARELSYGFRRTRPSRKRRIFFTAKHKKTETSSEARQQVDIANQISSLSLSSTGEEDSLLSLLPADLRKTVLADSQPWFNIRGIILDYGQRPYAIFTQDGGSRREWLHEDSAVLVTKEMISDITKNLNIGDDNRAGMDGMLHRISVMKNRSGEIYALTLRLGRAFENNASIIEDILLDEKYAKQSILVMGIPGSGKTSVIRSVAKCISENGKNVVIVDTSNEIGGDGDKVHKSLGICRRLMVPRIAAQSNVMLEGLQNHTPDVMVIDEISRKEEVIDVIIELAPDSYNEWKVIPDVGAAVDAIMNKRPYTFLKRSRGSNLRNPKIYEENCNHVMS
jgi:stage III sporulation protein SpoIIIAA